MCRFLRNMWLQCFFGLVLHGRCGCQRCELSQAQATTALLPHIIDTSIMYLQFLQLPAIAAQVAASQL